MEILFKLYLVKVNYEIQRNVRCVAYMAASVKTYFSSHKETSQALFQNYIICEKNLESKYFHYQ